MPVGEDEEGVVVEKLGDGAEVVGIIIGVGVLHIDIEVLQLDEEERQAVDKAHDVRSAAVEIAMDFQFLDGKEVIVLRLVEVDEQGLAGFGAAVRQFDGDGDTVADELVLFLVDLKE